MKQQIFKRAREIGFDLIGFTTPEPFINIYNKFKKTEKSNFLPPFMPTKDIELLTHPEKLFPGARSIISLGLSYAVHHNNKSPFKISSYARGQDYHLVMKNKLKALCHFIESLGSDDCNTKYYVDTAPLLEREIAVRAGLGWKGKNNCFINPKYGSYIFLGEIITDIYIEPDSSNNRYNCNDCKLCVKACPAGVLSDVKRSNFNSCLSYLTQQRGMLPKSTRRLFGRRIWGCDTCQKVCPYNSDIPRNIHSEFIVKITPFPHEILQFTKNNLPEPWQKSALTWRGVRILKRNTLIALANTKNKKYIPLIRTQLKSRSPVLQKYAKWALQEINNR